MRIHLHSLTTGTIPMVMLALGLAAPAAHAQFTGSHNLVTTADLSTLSAYLGEGPLHLTNIFEHVAGDGLSLAEFHAAVDGMGRTFIVLNAVSGDGLPHPEVIGGYDPVSWRSDGTSTVNSTDADRNAFLFNLTEGYLQRQNLMSQAAGFYGDTGQYQTYNGSDSGPTFGEGSDLGVYGDLDTGGVVNISYGGTIATTNLIGSPDGNYFSHLQYSGLEAFTIAPEVAATPEPSTIALIVGVGLSGSVLLKRRRRIVSQGVAGHSAAGN